jgi:hypothetical protein
VEIDEGSDKEGEADNVEDSPQATVTSVRSFQRHLILVVQPGAVGPDVEDARNKGTHQELGLVLEDEAEDRDGEEVQAGHNCCRKKQHRRAKGKYTGRSLWKGIVGRMHLERKEGRPRRLGSYVGVLTALGISAPHQSTNN